MKKVTTIEKKIMINRRLAKTEIKEASDNATVKKIRLIEANKIPVVLVSFQFRISQS